MVRYLSIRGLVCQCHIRNPVSADDLVKVGIERRLNRALSSYVIYMMRVNPAHVVETMQ